MPAVCGRRATSARVRSMASIEGDSREQQSLADAIPALYSELRRLASSYLRRERSEHTLQTTALVHEAYLRLVGQKQVRWENRDQLMGVAAQLMRRILVDHSRAHRAAKRGGHEERIVLDEALIVSKERGADVIAVDEALTRLAKFDASSAQLIELRFFAGLTIEEAARVLGISSTTAKRNWNVAKGWMARELRGEPQEDE